MTQTEKYRFFQLNRFVVVVPVLKYPVADLDVDSVERKAVEVVVVVVEVVEINRVNNNRKNDFHLNIYLFFL